MANIFNDFLKFKRTTPLPQQDGYKEYEKNRVLNFKNLIFNFNLARKNNDLQLQDFYFSEIEAFCRNFIIKNHINKYSWGMVYDNYEEDFFGLFNYQLLRRISDYWPSLTKDGKISKKQIESMEGKNFNFMSIVICLVKYVHETLINWYSEKRFGLPQLRKLMKSGKDISLINMPLYNSLNDAEKLNLRVADDQPNLEAQSHCLIENVKEFVQTNYEKIPEFKKKNLFCIMSYEELLGELDTGVLSPGGIKILWRFINQFPNYKETLKNVL